MSSQHFFQSSLDREKFILQLGYLFTKNLHNNKLQR